MDESADNDFRGPINPIKVNEISGLIKYLQSIDWTEPWFCGLAAFHVTCAILTVLTRNTGALQALYFCVLMVLVFCAEFINEWAANNWKLFTKEQYFDSNGLFISVVFSMPLLINCLVIVITWLWDVGMLIQNVKQMKIKQRSRQADKKKTKGNEITENTNDDDNLEDNQDTDDSETKKDK